MQDRLIHDAAWALSQVLLEVVKPCLRPEEWWDARSEFYCAAHAAIEAYEIQKARMLARLNPTKN
jgi:hypothetical protein